MLVSFRTTSNKLYQEEFDPSMTFAEIKKQMAEKYGYSAVKMRFLYNAKVLADTATLQSAQIQKGFIILHALPANGAQSKQETKPVETRKPEEIEQPVIPEEKKPAEPTCEPLPQHSRTNGRPDPPGFRAKVQQLMAMGFSEGDCENALRAALGNADRAADFILSGHIPEIPQMISTADIPVGENDDEELDEIMFSDSDSDEEADDDGAASLRRFTRFRDQLIRNPDQLRSFLNQMAEENPAVAGLIRDDPAAFLGSIGLNPDDFDLTGLGRTTEYERIMSQFNAEETAAIHELEKLGLDTMMIIQVFVACDKNKELARECLEGMK